MMNAKKHKIWSLILVMAMVVSMASGYVAKPATAKAASVDEVSPKVETVEEEATGNVNENETSPETATTPLETKEPEETNTSDQPTSEETTPGEPVTSEPDTQEPTTPEPTTEDPAAYTLIAHRGYSGIAPQNSIPAFERAVEAGYTMIEVDLQRTFPDATGKATWVLSHDSNLNNTMGVDAQIDSLTYAQILQYSYTKGSNVAQYPNLKIVSLEQLITLIKKYKDEGKKIKWQLELKKPDSGNDYRGYYEKEIVEPIKAAGIEDCISFSSFHYSYLKQIKAIDKNLHTWFLSTNLTDTAIDKYATECGADGISFKGSTATTSKEMVQKALNKGFKLGAYTLNSAVIMGAYYSWGVRSFATDDVTPMDVGLNMFTGKYNAKTFTCTLDTNSYTYDGKYKTPKVKVTYKGQELLEGLNYSIRYTNNKNPGTASVYVTGLNNCTDEYKIDYKIVMPKVTGFAIGSIKTTHMTLSWNKVNNATGYIIYKYNYTTKKYSAVKTITNAATTSYKVTGLKGATQYKYRVKAYVTVDGKTYKSDPCTAVSTYTRPASVKNARLERYHSHKRIRVRWNKVARATGYQVKIATNKKMTKNVKTYTVKGGNVKKLKIKKLSAKKTYYVKVRAYFTAGKTTRYGVYTSVMKSKKK